MRYKGYRITILILAALIVIETLLVIKLGIKQAGKITKVTAPIAKIAIVIDDWGYNVNNLDILNQIRYPLTASVLPNLNYTNEVAQQLHERGVEIMLHLPMEPHEKYRLEENTIMTSMDEKTVNEIISQDLANISYVKGVSNHMGSKATEDPRIMSIVFKVLKSRNLYFLDSFVSSESICFNLAKKIHLGFARRGVFLDNNEEPEYIRKQLEKLKKTAKSYGQAIGIGHDHKVTLEVLKEEMPRLEKQGYKFVFVSQMIKK
ncbi:MAG: divergent polysaccharide deacetylase family protein [Candidatus Omnitrophica bacterium]|nr:divergent polysaccharide deacetylase family protein [Candidatus Omnitrophota bacterium]